MKLLPRMRKNAGKTGLVGGRAGGIDYEIDPIKGRPIFIHLKIIP